MDIITQNKNTNQFVASIMENPEDINNIYDMGIILNKNGDKEVAKLLMEFYIESNGSPFGTQSKIANKIISEDTNE